MNQVMVLGALATLEQWVNPLLKGPACQTRLAQLSGSLFRIRLNPPDVVLWLSITSSGVVFYRHLDDEPDAWLELSPSALMKLVTTTSSTETMMSSGVHMGGDSLRLEALQALVQSLELDTTRLLSQFVGATWTDWGRSGLTGLRDWALRSWSSGQQDVRDYVHEEVRWAPAPHAMQRLEDELSELRLSLDRLEARVGQLEHRLTGV
ncbi:hypothetical protein BFW38_12410 [Terasakiispira papahanaumokuakeensis]|uniref:SCP2 domain-containing protein n=1 Tax=Terasakiispira papahanaumokuakeensis TaxID=197479 RepID=A0A1E2VB56_9GAMM|nr:SCP2 sterol-binding domain-containing protein [Terasakiispira papahanaumokuakeensis]ODC04211.1 hypothetical protein BFW38_12410 [Terasakiispira papahanaumokuakeensis]